MADLREQVVDFMTGGQLSRVLGESDSLRTNLKTALKESESLREVVGQIANDEELLVERLAELELALEDANWVRLMAEGEREFSREGLRTIAGLARMMFLKNPLINRSVMVQALYVWAQGVNVRVKDATINEALQAFWDDADNQAELTGHQARMFKEIDLRVEGNIFFVFFVNPSSGAVKVRSFEPDEISEIISNPEDAKSPWLYLRTWTEKRLNPVTGRGNTIQRRAYYPDWRYKPSSKPAKFGRIEVMWDTPVYHVRTGGLASWKFGLSEIYAAIDWARAYKEFLEDVASLMRSYARFAWNLKFKGGKKVMQAAKSKLNSTLGNEGSAGETNPAPVTGSTFLGSDMYEMQPMNLRGASIAPEDGRRFLLMVAAAMGLPETFYGDVSVGTLATGKTLDRPTELMMRNRQLLWTDILRNIFQFVLLWSVKATAGKLHELGKVEGTTNSEGIIEEKVVWNESVQALIDIDFPPVLERDVQAAVQAIVTAATLNGQELAIFDEPTVARLLLTALAQDDVDELMNALYPDDGNSIGPGTEASTAMVKKALGKFVEALGGEKSGWLSVVKASPLQRVEGQAVNG